MKLTEEDVEKVLRIVDELHFGEIRLEFGELKLHVVKRRVGEAAPVTSFQEAAAPPPAPAPIAPSPAAAEHVRKAQKAPRLASLSGHVVKAPFAGVVYHAPKPGAPPFVKVGELVKAEQTVCLLEVMKLFQSVPAGIAGRVTAVLFEDGAATEEGAPLFTIDPVVAP
jgi:acetyl-CoA carboxylase biotin carboxyl carrier protein